MTNVVSFDERRMAAFDAQRPALSSKPLPGPDLTGSLEVQCIRAAAILAEACADWSLILLHRPCPAGAELLADSKLLIHDLLLVGGIAPPPAGDFPVPTPQELANRTRALKEKAFALGVLIQEPTR